MERRQEEEKKEKKMQRYIAEIRMEVKGEWDTNIIQYFLRNATVIKRQRRRETTTKQRFVKSDVKSRQK